MPRILIITYYFPPWGMGGVQRVLKFAKYLPEFGWDVTIIAPQPSSYHHRDSTLLDGLPGSVHVERLDYVTSTMPMVPGSSMLRPIGRWLSSWRNFPDRHKRFATLAAKRASELMREKPFDVVLTSSPPPSVHLAGFELKRDTPWVADFRDPWQALVDDYGPSFFHRLRNSGLHQRLLKSADAVIAVTPELRKHFEADCGGGNVTVIRNGYDDADFAGLDADSKPGPELRVVLPGTLSRFSDPRPILRALAAYRSRNPARQLHITHVGATMDCDLPRLVAESGLTEAFHDVGYLDHRSAIQAMLDSDILMLAYADPRVTDVSVPGRIYEMLRTLRPIIALTPSPSALANLLAPIESCAVLPPDDTGAIAKAIEQLAAVQATSRTLAQIKQFDRREETRQLSELLHTAVQRRQGK